MSPQYIWPVKYNLVCYWNMAASVASFVMRTAQEEDDTILDFDVEFDLLRFLSSVPDRTD